MPNSKIVTAIGVINGVNLRFLAGEPYVAGFTRYILNGRIHAPNSDDYSFTESNPDNGEITVSVAPLDGDVVQLFIVDRRPTVIAAVQQLDGTLRKQPVPLSGVLTTPSRAQLEGTITKKKLSGSIVTQAPARLQGTLNGRRLSGVLKKGC